MKYQGHRGGEGVVCTLYVVTPASTFQMNPYSFLVAFSFRAVIGEIDEEADANLDLSSIRADPLNAVVY